MDSTDLLVVFLAALVTALATGLGALPLLFVRSAGRRALGVCNAAAAGVMASASVALVLEGGERSWWKVAAGAAAGAIFVLAAGRLLDSGRDLRFATLSGEDATRGLLIVAVMTAHSVAEGVGIGSAFGGGETLGWLIAIAIAVHNIPEGLAISLVLVPRGTSVGRAAWWSIFSSLPQPLLAVPAFLFVDAFESLLPAGLGFAAGAMLWMVARELLPEALEQAPARLALPVLALAFAVMAAFQAALL